MNSIIVQCILGKAIIFEQEMIFVINPECAILELLSKYVICLYVTNK